MYNDYVILPCWGTIIKYFSGRREMFPTTIIPVVQEKPKSAQV